MPRYMPYEGSRIYFQGFIKKKGLKATLRNTYTRVLMHENKLNLADWTKSLMVEEAA